MGKYCSFANVCAAIFLSISTYIFDGLELRTNTYYFNGNMSGSKAINFETRVFSASDYEGHLFRETLFMSNSSLIVDVSNQLHLICGKFLVSEKWP